MVENYARLLIYGAVEANGATEGRRLVVGEMVPLVQRTCCGESLTLGENLSWCLLGTSQLMALPTTRLLQGNEARLLYSCWIDLTLRLIFHVLAPRMLVMLSLLGVLVQQGSRPQRHDKTHLCPA